MDLNDTMQFDTPRLIGCIYKTENGPLVAATNSIEKHGTGLSWIARECNHGAV